MAKTIHPALSSNSGCQGTYLFRIVTRPIRRPDEVRCLNHLHYRFLQWPFSLASHMHLSLLTDCNCIVLTQFLKTQVSPVSAEELVLLRCACWVSLVLPQRTLSLFELLPLESAQLKILRAVPVIIRLGTLLISFRPVLPRPYYTTRSWATLFSIYDNNPGRGKLPGFCGFMVLCYVHIKKKRPSINNYS